MLILLISGKNKGPRPVTEADDETFRRHDEAMKQFRLGHPDLDVVRARDIVLANDDLLAPVNNVKLADNARN
jgi:hypothetical protein